MSEETTGIIKNRPACLICRSRKVRCGKELPECQKCQKLGVKCPGYDASIQDEQSVERIYRESSIEKRRVGSCLSCRKMKLRCDRQNPACSRCQQKHLFCQYSSVPLGSHSWIYDSRLPEEPEQLLMLINGYFDRVYPLRCLGLVHRPSFIHALDQGRLVEEFGEPLVQIVCAFGAYVHALDLGSGMRTYSSGGPIPGESWASKARSAVLEEMGTPNLKTAMTLVLIAEHAAWTGQNAWSFLLAGAAFRVTRLLELDIAKDNKTTAGSAEAIEIETARRVLWACYLLDAQIGSGVDKNLNWREDAPLIRLPSNEEAFINGKLPQDDERATLTSFPSLPARFRANLRANHVYLGWVRSQILRINRATHFAVEIWSAQSPYLHLLQTIETWYSALPEELRLTDLNIYAHKERNTVAAVFMLHFAYHSAVADLTRVSLPGFDFPLSSFFKNAPPSFRRQCQERCRHHADEISKLVELGLLTGGRALDEPFCITSAFEATKIQVVHTTTLTPNGPAERQRAREQIRTNWKLILTSQNGLNPRARNYVSGLPPLLSKFGFQDTIPQILYEPDVSETEQEVEVVGPADTDHLSQAANFRQALGEVQQQLRTKGQPHSPPGSQLSARKPNVAQQAAIPAITAHPTSSILPPDGPALSMDATLTGPGYHHLAEDVDYFQLAEEMSNYMTWDFSELPPWIDFDQQEG